MIGGKKTEQTTGAGGTNISSEGPTQVVIVGIDEKRAREIVHEMHQAQIESLSHEAKVTALHRAQQFEEKFIERIKSLEQGFDSLRRPDVQFALIEAKRSFAESGDESASDISIDIISDYLSRDERNPSNPIFREAIKAASKIDGRMADIISALFFITRCGPNFDNIDDFSDRSYLRLRSYLNTNLNRVPLKTHFTNHDFLVLNLFGLVSKNSLFSIDYSNYCNSLTSKFPMPFTEKEIQLHNESAGEQLFVKFDEDIFFVKSSAPHLEFTFKYDPKSKDLSSDINYLNELTKVVEKAKSGKPTADQAKVIIESIDRAGHIKTAIERLPQGWEITPVGTAIAISRLKRLGMPLDERIWFE